MKRTFFAVLLVCFLVPAALHAANSAFDYNFGEVKRLYPSTDRVYFQLQGGKTLMNPSKGYYYIPQSHPNYQVLVDLLFKAAENNWTVKVRTKDDLDSNGYAEVGYIVIDF